MPSKPLLGMPVVVGTSDAVMAMRRTFSWERAGDRQSSRVAKVEARRRKRRASMASPSMGPRVGADASPRHASGGPERRIDGWDNLVYRYLDGSLESGEFPGGLALRSANKEAPISSLAAALPQHHSADTQARRQTLAGADEFPVVERCTYLNICAITA